MSDLSPLSGRKAEVEFRDRLEGRDVLIVKADRQEPLVVARLSMAAGIASQITDGNGREHPSRARIGRETLDDAPDRNRAEGKVGIPLATRTRAY